MAGRFAFPGPPLHPTMFLSAGDDSTSTREGARRVAAISYEVEVVEQDDLEETIRRGGLQGMELSVLKDTPAGWLIVWKTPSLIEMR